MDLDQKLYVASGVLLGIFALGFFYLKRLIQRSFRTKAEYEALINSLDIGIVVVDKQGRVMPGASAAAQRLFDGDPTDKSFIDILDLKDSELSQAKEWIQELFIESDFSLGDFLKLGPSQIERPGGQIISLEYKAIVSKRKTIDKLICLAVDVTNEKHLEEKVEEERALAQTLIAVLNDKETFGNFVSDIRRCFKAIFQELNKNSHDFDLEKVFRMVHTMKGTSYQFHMSYLAGELSEIETQLDEMRAKGISEKLGSERLRQKIYRIESYFEGFLRQNEKYWGRFDNKEVVTSTLPVDQVYGMLDQIENSLGKDHDIYQTFLNKFLLSDLANEFLRFTKIISRLAESEMKEAVLTVISVDSKIFFPYYRSLFSSFIHVFRNAIDHGIEYPEERVKKGKMRIGRIEVNADVIPAESGDILRMSIEDDGKGLDAQVIKSRIIERGLLSQERTQQLPDQEAFQYIFRENFSLAKEQTNLSGRGVGLDAVQTEVIRLGGRVWAESKNKKGTTIIIEVPYVAVPTSGPDAAATSTKLSA